MDPKLLYWTGAFANMGVVVALAVRGVWLRRRGEIARHRRHMLGGGALVLLFLVSYALKLAWLGREALEHWSAADVWVLRLHETCVLAMLVGGGFAASRGFRLAGTRAASGRADDPPAPPALARWHRRGGWLAVSGAVLGLLSAGLVLLGMYRRAGIL
jgi:hypothetical protein